MGGGRGQTPKYSSTILQSFLWYFPSFSPHHPAHPHTPNPFTPRKNNHISLPHELGGGGRRRKEGTGVRGLLMTTWQLCCFLVNHHQRHIWRCWGSTLKQSTFATLAKDLPILLWRCKRGVGGRHAVWEGRESQVCGRCVDAGAAKWQAKHTHQRAVAIKSSQLCCQTNTWTIDWQTKTKERQRQRETQRQKESQRQTVQQTLHQKR